nr:hypothetical protein [Paenibacillus terrigena]
MAEPNWGYYSGNNDKPGINDGISKGSNDSPHGTRIQIEVESIDDAINKSLELGAQVLRGKMEFDNFYLAYLVDPVGNEIGLIQTIN